MSGLKSPERKFGAIAPQGRRWLWRMKNADASSLQSMVRGLVSPSLELLILWGSKYPTRLSWHRFSEAKIAFMGPE
jgi:hypothetical protein